MEHRLKDKKNGFQQLAKKLLTVGYEQLSQYKEAVTIDEWDALTKIYEKAHQPPGLLGKIAGIDGAECSRMLVSPFELTDGK